MSRIILCCPKDGCESKDLEITGMLQNMLECQSCGNVFDFDEAGHRIMVTNTMIIEED